MQHQKLDHIFLKNILGWKGVPNRGDISKGTLITGLAKIIMTYRNSINNAQRLPEKSQVDMVKLIGLDELVQLESDIMGQGIP